MQQSGKRTEESRYFSASMVSTTTEGKGSSSVEVLYRDWEPVNRKGLPLSDIFLSKILCLFNRKRSTGSPHSCCKSLCLTLRKKGTFFIEMECCPFFSFPKNSHAAHSPAAHALGRVNYSRAGRKIVTVLSSKIKLNVNAKLFN